MKIVLNKDFGGFMLPAGFAAISKWDLDGDWKDENGEWHTIRRDDPELVAYVESHPKDSDDLVVVETVAGEITDYEISDYDGYESLIYVVGGKIHHA